MISMDMKTIKYVAFMCTSNVMNNKEVSRISIFYD